MSSAAQRIPTFDELYQAIVALPPGLTGEILEPGVIRTMSRPGGAHRFGAKRVARALSDDDASEGGHGWWLEQEAENRFLGDRLAVPDLSGWRVDHDDALPPALVYDNPIVVTSDWCCEVLSSTTEKTDREIKVPLYAAAGVPWIWLVDPARQRIEVLRAAAPGAEAELVETVEGDVTRAIPPFASMVCTSTLWLPPPR